eukprot:375276-Rhodomonas_salina.1
MPARTSTMTSLGLRAESSHRLRRRLFAACLARGYPSDLCECAAEVSGNPRRLQAPASKL